MTTEHRFVSELRQGLVRCQVGHARLLVGVSGGADSVALLRGLLELHDEFGLSLHIAHLNHQLRKADSDADAEWVVRLGQALLIPVKAGLASIDVTSCGSGIEEAARQARHHFLDQSAIDLGCDVIATAHTADDQVETQLHHLFRGTGLSGLRGIPAVRTLAGGQRLVRPMLAIRRETIEDYLASIGQEYRTDATNSDVSFTRNWLRHRLLPELRNRLGSQVDANLCRLAEQAAEVELALSILAERLLSDAVLDAQPDAVRLNTRILVEQPVHLVREVFRVLWQRQQWPRQAMGFDEWNRVATVAQDGGSADLPGGIRIRHNPPGLLVLGKTNR